MNKKPDISKLNKKAPFEVPKDYFEKLPDIIQSRILAEEEEKVLVFDTHKIGNKLPFEVPQDYFEKLPDIIQNRIALEEEEEAKTLDSLKVGKKLPFDVPNRYFDELPSIIQARALETEGNKGFSWSLGNPKAQRALLPAMIAVFIVGFSLFFNNSTSNYDTDELIAQVSSDDLIAYLEMSEISTEEILSSVNFDKMDFEFNTEETDMLDELNFSEEDMNDILVEFDLETGV